MQAARRHLAHEKSHKMDGSPNGFPLWRSLGNLDTSGADTTPYLTILFTSSICAAFTEIYLPLSQGTSHFPRLPCRHPTLYGLRTTSCSGEVVGGHCIGKTTFDKIHIKMCYSHNASPCSGKGDVFRVPSVTAGVQQQQQQQQQQRRQTPTPTPTTTPTTTTTKTTTTKEKDTTPTKKNNNNNSRQK